MTDKNYDDFFSYNDKKHEEETRKRKERSAGPSTAHKDKLITKKGYDYSMVLVPYIHGAKGLPPIIEVAMHFRVGGTSFPCLYQNGIEETCAADQFVQHLWDKWNENEQAYGKQSNQCKQIVSLIQGVQANNRWYSPVLVVDVRDSNGDRVIEERDKWKGRVVWWDYPETIFNQLDKEIKQKGSIWNPTDPALIIASKEDARSEKTNKSYIKPTIVIDFPRDKGKYKIVKNQKQLHKLLESVPNIYDSGIFTMLSNEEISKLINDTYNKKGEEKATEFPPPETNDDNDGPFAPDTRDDEESDEGDSENVSDAANQVEELFDASVFDDDEGDE